MREIPVRLEPRHRVVIGSIEGCERGDFPEFARSGRAAVLVTDENVGPLWAEPVRRLLDGKGLEIREEIRIPPGEASKDLGSLERLLDRICAAQLRRESWIVALGGGVVGDLAGFAAAVYLRGIPWVQIPTSLLAMSDSSIGGKVGVNFRGGKNQIGAFHQPSLILVLPECLATLAERELSCGTAEMIKAAMIGDPALFSLLEESLEPIWKRDPGLLEEAIARSISLKVRIVERDERERGERRFLNLGHTIGHALESALAGEGIRHGEAVAIGLVAACQLAVLRGVDTEETRDRVEKVLTAHRLPTRAVAAGWNEVRRWLDLDKKAAETGGAFVLTEGIGRVSVHRQIPESSIRAAVEYILS